ncbi:DUF3828 domain-containing protein [Escherichia sp. E4742]|uniref:DUF3828 domain-containing protein n=1 Tax=Escherichia sp. E4742 TaxID=2044467 RepID=UPI0010818F8F|nr:DUF3828 domain-containing protein [Escherichia sp. E4742]QCT87886.1 DUF3828 domain-containing protein [Escherichia sp. E4742]QLN17551.1 DUF3828 domain-containing protein [Escherichia coli]TGB55712.1 hypothetical protein CRI69_19295 [Escherichia sp. E4742]TLJ07116.1 DUF3828 domain-containing protein [Escherichia sp. E4742]
MTKIKFVFFFLLFSGVTPSAIGDCPAHTPDAVAAKFYSTYVFSDTGFKSEKDRLAFFQKYLTPSLYQLIVGAYDRNRRDYAIDPTAKPTFGDGIIFTSYPSDVGYEKFDGVTLPPAYTPADKSATIALNFHFTVDDKKAWQDEALMVRSAEDGCWRIDNVTFHDDYDNPVLTLKEWLKNGIERPAE